MKRIAIALCAALALSACGSKEEPVSFATLEDARAPAADLAFALIVTPVVLKLMGYIDWSWWYVTLPFWGGAAVVLGVLLIALLFAAVAEMRRR